MFLDKDKVVITGEMNFFDKYGNWSPYYRTIDWKDLLVELNKLSTNIYTNEKKKTVVLKWQDDTITKVKTSENDKFDVLYGFLLAYFQKHCGMTKNKANRYLEKIVEKEQKK